MKIKQRLTHNYVENDVRYSIVVSEAKFGWSVTFKRNGVEMRKVTAVGSLMTVMADAMSGML